MMQIVRDGPLTLLRDAVYARISEDDLGTEKGVIRQVEDCTALSKARGGRVVGTYTDNDVSALHGAYREQYQALMAAVDAGLVDRVIVYMTSRFWRNRKERADGIERLRRAGVPLLAVKGPELDMTTAAGRLMAGILGEFDTAESEIKGERVARAARQRAQEGRASGVVGYGWRRVYEYNEFGKRTGWRDVESPEQAAIVREIVRRLLAGDTLRQITEDLNERGVPAPRAGDKRAKRAVGQTPDGMLWGKTSVRKLATRRANVAERVHHRGRPDEMWLPAAWPALIDRADHDRVVTQLAAAEVARGVIVRPGARVHLLSWGIGQCGICKGHLRVSPKGKPGHKVPLYCCDEKGCVGRNEARVDEYVRDLVIARSRRRDALDLLVTDDGERVRLQKEAERIRMKLATAADAWMADLITDDQLYDIKAKLEPQLREAEAAERRIRPTPHLPLLGELVASESPRDVWDSWTIIQRHAVVGVWMEAVKIMPTRQGAGFNPADVKPVWRTKRVARRD